MQFVHLITALQVVVGAFATVPSSSFNVTAIAAVNGASRLQCWQLSSPLVVTSTSMGIVEVQQFGNLANASWSRYPANFVTSVHPAPYVQWVVFLSGETIIRLPSSSDEAFFFGGKYGLMLATDTADVSPEGHFTDTGNGEVTGLEIPTADGLVPGHHVLHGGPCVKNDLNY
ncbi:hypothetical protein MMC25_001521 [Agyrium rufum]|nr:hypothetical protein [Agyrium rufum]